MIDDVKTEWEAQLEVGFLCSGWEEVHVHASSALKVSTLLPVAQLIEGNFEEELANADELLSALGKETPLFRHFAGRDDWRVRLGQVCRF